jgi:DnaK suppressor protein
VSEREPELSTEYIDAQRKRLQALREQIAGNEDHARVSEQETQALQGVEAKEYEDGAQDMARKEIEQALHDVDRGRLSNINRALQKIEEGNYGLSDKSGKRIPKARLDATPEATLRVDEAP